MRKMGRGLRVSAPCVRWVTTKGLAAESAVDQAINPRRRPV